MVQPFSPERSDVRMSNCVRCRCHAVATCHQYYDRAVVAIMLVCSDGGFLVVAVKLYRQASQSRWSGVTEG